MIAKAINNPAKHIFDTKDNLLLSILFLPKYVGISALAYGMGGCMTITTILNCITIYKKTNISGLILKPFILMTIFSIPSSLLSNWNI